MNNDVENLEYISTLANIAHARVHGLLCVKGAKNNKAKLSDAEVSLIRDEYSRGATQVSLGMKYGVTQTTISRIVLRKAWAHVK